MFNHALVDVQSFVSSSFDKKCILATNKLVVFLNLHDVQTQWLSVLSVVFHFTGYKKYCLASECYP